MLEHFKSMLRAGRRRLRLDAQRADARAGGRREVGQPVARAASTAPRSSARCARRTSRSVELLGPVPRAQAARCTSCALQRRLGRRAPALRHHRSAFYDRFTPAIGARDFALRGGGDLDRALDFLAVCRRERRRRARRARARPAHPHALRRGLRHVAVRRGVAVGGDRDLATCRCSTCSSDGAPADALAHAGAVRPARGAGRRRALRCASCATCARDSHALDVDGLRAGGEHELARRARARGGRLRARGRALRGARRRPARRAARRTRRGPRRPPTRCCRCWRPTPACGCSSRPGSTRTARARSATLGAAASGCRSARTRRGSTRCSRRPACTRRASTSPTCSAAARAAHLRAAARRRPGRCSCRSTARRSSSCGATAATRPTAPTATTTTARSHHHRPWANDGARLRPRARALAQAREHAADFVARASRGAGRPGGGPVRSCALDTELLGHWWYEGPSGCAAVIDEAARAGARARAARRRARRGTSRRRRSRRRCRVTTWGTPRDLSTWTAPQVADLAWRARDGRAARRRRRRRGADAARACASCSRCRPATGPSWSRASSPAPTRASAPRATRAALDEALRDRLRAAARCATSRPTLVAAPRCCVREPRVLILSWEYPPLDRGRARAPRAQALRAARGRRASRSTS